MTGLGGGPRRVAAWTRWSRTARLLFSARPATPATVSLQIRLTISLLSALLPLFLVMAAASAAVRVKPMGAYECTLGALALGFAILGWRFAVIGRQRTSAWLITTTNLIFAFLVALTEDDPVRATASFLFALVGVLWASFLLPPRDTSLAAIASLVLGILLPAVHPSLSYAQMVLPFFFNTFAVTFVVLVSYLRQRHLVELERRNARLAEGQQQLRVTMDSSLDAVVTCSSDGIVSDWSRQAESIFGVGRAAALGKNFTDLCFDAEDAGTVRALIGELANSPGATRRTEVRPRRSDGALFPAELSASGLTLGGRPACAIFIRDISERRRMQAELIQSDRLVSVGRLAAGVAHEINNPMTYVLANLQYARELVDEHRPALGEEGEEIDEVLADATEGARRVHQIVKELRTFAHGGSEERVPVQLAGVLDSAAQLAWNEIRHRARLVKRYDENVPSVLGNAARLGQVFLNLLVNAVQALPRDGREHEIRLTLRSDGATVFADVSDTGGGISPEISDRMFLPFVTTKKAGEGLGLGLYISRNIVGALGGDIRVKSEAGVGTTFTVSLPAHEAAPGAVAKVLADDPAPSVALATDPPLSILLVDDDEAVLRTLQRTLARHRVTTVAGGVEALDLCTRRRFDLVLCDVMMPGMTGVELAGLLCEGGLVAEERLCFLTGGAFTVAEQEYLAKHPHKMLDKPIDLRRLNDLLQRTADAMRTARSA